MEVTAIFCCSLKFSNLYKKDSKYKNVVISLRTMRNNLPEQDIFFKGGRRQGLTLLAFRNGSVGLVPFPGLAKEEWGEWIQRKFVGLWEEGHKCGLLKREEIVAGHFFYVFVITNFNYDLQSTLVLINSKSSIKISRSGSGELTRYLKRRLWSNRNEGSSAAGGAEVV